MRRCKTVSQTGGAPAGDAQTVCDGANTVRVHALDIYKSATVPGSLSERRGTCRRLPDSLRRCQVHLGTAGDPETVCKGARKSTRPVMHLQETHRQFATVPRPSGHMQ
ncbi:hypothetical protein DPMN_129681 [Dreissena polymorpha]|uniref:Uncharacterized protein n=1 Tax=Dreissena polymorpha TaxID=45954 RepID=A0A9D4H388_DREPO|nr:hypothetical protein DPMN_129681 [Dreissena polymorpha]